MKKEPVISDYISDKEKAELKERFFKEEEKKIALGGKIVLFSAVALCLNAVMTTAIYPLFLEDILISAFVPKPEDGRPFIPEAADLFPLRLVIGALIIIKPGLAIAAAATAAAKKGTRPMTAVSSGIFTFCDIIVTSLMLTDVYTYNAEYGRLYLVINAAALALALLCVYFSVFTDYISRYVYDKNSRRNSAAPPKNGGDD